MRNNRMFDISTQKCLVIPCVNKYEEVDAETFEKLSKDSVRKDGKLGSSDNK